jgi:hypothetical protein
MPVCPWFLVQAVGSVLRSLAPSGASSLFAHLTAAKLGWWERSLLHIDRYRGLQDPTFFHAASAMNPYL